jgi:PTH1 family peptidyl-tRNA hydrolase
MIKLLVGLGNPGSQYDKTRHNAGFWFLDELASRSGMSFRDEGRFQGAAAKLERKGGVIYLLKPLTYMNRSGQSVAALTKYFKIEPEEILVAHDELDLPPGQVRLKRGGGHGGHNGLRDLISSLGSAEFFRLRLGIGHPGDRAAVVKYVLSEPSRVDEGLVHEAITKALDFLPDILDGNVSAAMNRLHAAPKSSHPTKENG